MKVFISSTSEDLKAHREAAAAVVRDAQGQAVVMEHGPADPRPIVDVCREWVQACDLVLLIVAFRRGWVPDIAKGGDGAASITALEIAEADRLKRPVLTFFADDNWPGKLWDDDAEARAWVRSFRANLNRTAKCFSWEADPKLPSLRALISQELANYRLRLNTRTAAHGGASDASPGSNTRGVLSNRSLPPLEHAFEVVRSPVPFRIFLSSPGDVAEERAKARDLLLGLARRPFLRDKVLIDVVSWDDPHAPAPMDARLTPVRRHRSAGSPAAKGAPAVALLDLRTPDHPGARARAAAREEASPWHRRRHGGTWTRQRAACLGPERVGEHLALRLRRSRHRQVHVLPPSGVPRGRGDD